MTPRFDEEQHFLLVPFSKLFLARSLPMNRSRRLFVANTAGSTMALMFGGCGGGGSYADTPVPAPAPAPAPAPTASALSCGATAISANHGHALTIPAGDVNSTVDMVYGIAGSADHNHLITLTAAQFAQIKASTPVTVASTIGGDGHTHAVTVSCA